MLYHTKSPGGDAVTVITYDGNLVSGAPFVISIGCGVTSAVTLGVLCPPVLGADLFPSHLPPSTVIPLKGSRLLDGEDWFDGIYLRYLLRLSSIKQFLQGFHSSQREVAFNENTVVHTNISGKTIDSLGGTEYLHPMLGEDEPSSEFSYGYTKIQVLQSAGNVVEVSPSGYITTGYGSTFSAVIGLHTDYIFDRMLAGDYDEAWRKVFFFPIRTEDPYELCFLAYEVDQGWGGSYNGSYKGYKVLVRSAVAPSPRILLPGTHLLDIADVYGPTLHVWYSDMVSGTVYDGYDYKPSDAEVRGLLLVVSRAHTGMKYTGADTLTPTHAYLASLSDVDESATHLDLLDAVGYDPVRNYYYRTSPDRFQTFSMFEERAVPELGRLIGGTYLSAVDAMENFLSGANSNYIESLSEIGEILSPLDVVRAARKVITDPKDPSTLVAILKLLANANLAYKFGVVPTVADAKDIARQIPRLLKKLNESIFVDQTAYGKASVSLPDGTIPGFTNCHVTLRTKARLRVDPDGLLSTVFTLEQMGALPTLSRLWDVIPYSWLADYFVDIGGIGNLVDEQVLMLMCNVEYTVNSVLVSRGLVVDEPEFNFRTLSQNWPEYKLFARIVFPRALPVLGPTSVPLFHTLEASHLRSKWDILGSVIIQKIG
jgi:hypothetical protein